MPALPSSSPFPQALAACADLWRGDELGAADGPARPTGHAALDAQLPGGGWPVGALTELLQPAPDAPVWPLLLPALAAAVAERQAPVVLVGPPHEPFGPALAGAGLPMQALLWVRAETAAERLWACEQALRCAGVAAVLAWLPQARAAELRRLQLAAARHAALLFVLRPEADREGASPARLRLRVAPSEGRPDQLDVQVLKRRGPPMAAPLALPARSAHMAALLAAAGRRRRMAVPDAASAGGGATVLRLDPRRPRRTDLQEAGHALAGAVVAA